MAKTKKERVYIISNMKAGIIKIGVSINPEKRLRNLQCQCGQSLFLWHQTIPINCAYKLESMLHKHFAEYRTYGEWFRISKKGATLQVKKFMNELRSEGVL